MSNVYRLLTKLTLNRWFAQDFLDAPEPCCALSVIEERKQVLPLVAFRPGVVLPYGVTEQGFDFGHSVLGGEVAEELCPRFGLDENETERLEALQTKEEHEAFLRQLIYERKFELEMTLKPQGLGTRMS